MMLFFYFLTKKRFSENKYLENMESEVAKLIADIQFQSETCIRLLEDKIDEANEVIKSAQNSLGLINKELSTKKNEVVVLDSLMSKNTKRVQEEQQKVEEKIKIYSDNPAAVQNLATEQVLAMHRSGLSPDKISQETGMPMGEITLIISLDQK